MGPDCSYTAHRQHPRGFGVALVTPGFAAGLEPGEDDFPEFEGWLQRAHDVAGAVAAMRPSLFGDGPPSFGPHGLPVLLEHDGTGALIGRVVVVHPLRRLDAGAARRLLGADAGGTRIRFVDTFNLERRLLPALELAVGREHAYPQVDHLRSAPA